MNKHMHFAELRQALASDDPDVQDEAIRRLEELGGAQAISLLAACLDERSWRQQKGFDPDWRGPHGERLQGRMVYEPLSHLAIRALARLVPDPPSTVPDLVTEEDVVRWKEWWELNRSKYEKEGG